MGGLDWIERIVSTQDEEIELTEWIWRKLNE